MALDPIYFAPVSKPGGGYICFKDSPSPPPPVDYAGAAKAQGQANIDAVIASQKLNNPNINSVYGTQTWVDSQDPSVRPGLTQTLSPSQQALYDKDVQTKGLMGDLGIQAANSLKGVLGTPLDLSGLPAPAGSYDNVRRSVIDAMMSRANEDYGKQTDNLNSDLVARGIMPGNKAYGDARQMVERSRNDARTQAEIAGGNAAAQAYGIDAQRRQTALAELLQKRNVPLSELNALRTGSQPSNPFSVPGASQGSNIAPSPIFGGAQAQNQYGTGLYNAQQGAANSFQNGLFSLGSAGLMGSGGFKGLGGLFGLGGSSGLGGGGAFGLDAAAGGMGAAYGGGALAGAGGYAAAGETLAELAPLLLLA